MIDGWRRAAMVVTVVLGLALLGATGGRRSRSRACRSSRSAPAFGVGELVARTHNRDGTATWHWREELPTAPYLTTAGPRAQRRPGQPRGPVDHGNIDLEEFLEVALEMSELSDEELRRLQAYFDQWLSAERRPTIVPAGLVVD